MFRKLMERVGAMMGRGTVDEAFYEELEEALIQADTHHATADQIIADLRKEVAERSLTRVDDVKEALQQIIASRFRFSGGTGLAINDENPTVYLFVGVNGVGKTTTIAKLANLLVSRYRAKVLVAAGDTFRAAAIEQLETWAERVGADIVRAQPGADSSSVLFDAIQAAKARGAQFVLCDTAGRQHSKGNLMAELHKVARVTQKSLGRDPDEVLLVLDANTGQNAVRQAEEFGRVAGVTGIVLTKLDGTAKGGALIGLFETLKVPVKLIGVGEKVDDLRDFDPQSFAKGLFE